MVFIKDILRTKVAIRCDTEDKAKTLLKELKDKFNYTWSQTDYKKTSWNTYEDKTCYSVYEKTMFYSPIDYYNGENFKIIEFDEIEDFMSRTGLEKEYWEIINRLDELSGVDKEIKELKSKKIKISKLMKDKDYKVFVELSKKFSVD